MLLFFCVLLLTLSFLSLRKFAATWCSQRGCSQEEVEKRGRWKGKKNGAVVNRYISPEQLPTDAKVASILCFGGPVTYRLKDDANLTPEFIRMHVLPGIYNLFSSDPSNHIVDVLGPALLYLCHTPGLEHMVSEAVRNRVTASYHLRRGQHPPEYNPVEKIPLSVYRVENEVVIEPITWNGGGGNNSDENGPAGVVGNGFGGVGHGGISLGLRATEEKLDTVLASVHRLDTRGIQWQQQTEVRFFLYFTILFLHLTKFLFVLL